jgi:Domain of unknown function (DUF6378)
MNKTTLKQAEEIIYGDREKTYGHPSKNLDKIAKIWSTIFGIEVTIEQVCWAMVGLKMARASNPSSGRVIDNEVDAIGYLALIDRCDETTTSLESKNIPTVFTYSNVRSESHSHPILLGPESSEVFVNEECRMMWSMYLIAYRIDENKLAIACNYKNKSFKWNKDDTELWFADDAYLAITGVS